MYHSLVGGRLRLCIQNGRKICCNSWVLNVWAEGYKIPFKFVPFQRACPKNWEVSGLAFEVLKQEAADLLAWGAAQRPAPRGGMRPFVFEFQKGQG